MGSYSSVLVLGRARYNMSARESKGEGRMAIEDDDLRDREFGRLSYDTGTPKQAIRHQQQADSIIT